MIAELHRTDRNAADALAAMGILLDRRCAGRGTCGRCRIKLLSGVWRAGEKTLLPPMEVQACQTFLRSDCGTVEIPDAALFSARETGNICTNWHVQKSLPDTADLVAGVDIGTTTIAVAWLQNGRIVAQESAFNPQSQFGDNVIARIAEAETHGAELTASVRTAIRELLAKFDAPRRIAISGNTVMSTLFHGINPASIGTFPFTPPCRFFPETSARDLHLGVDVPVLTVPCISGYLGGDVTAGLAEVELGENELLADVGTNCEIVLRAHGRRLGTAAAAGPAFEGAGLSVGMRAVPGAISRYRNESTFEVIGDVPPRGVCGSAWIDVIAELLRQNAVSAVGRLGAPQREIAPGIAMTERDMEQLLKAKAAVFAGITALARYAQVPLSKVHLAGGFAEYLDVANAQTIGMLPGNATYQIHGNTSLAGALRLAASPENMATLTKLADEVTEIPLNTIPGFEDDFIDALLLGE